MNSRPIAVPRWATYALLFGLYLTARGYQSLDGDQAYRLPLLLHRQDPALYADDPFVRALDAFNPHRGYLALLDLASRPLGLDFGLFALFAATFGLTCYGVSRLARSTWPELGPSVGLVAVGFVLMAKAGNIGTNHLFEPILLDRLIGFALGWVALALAVEGQRRRPALLLGLAAVVHPTVGLQLGGLLGAGWVAWAIAGRRAGVSWRSTVVGLFLLGLALMPGALPNVLLGRKLFVGLSPDAFRRLGVELQMAQHMVPSLWRKPQWLAWGGYVVLGGMALAGSGRRVWAEPNLRESARLRVAILFGVLLVGLGAAYGMVEVVGDLRATVFQPFRMATIARGLALVALSGRCVGLWRRGDLLGKGRVLVLAAGLTGDWAFVVAVVVELVASVVEFLSGAFDLARLTPHPNPPPQGGRGPERAVSTHRNPPPLWGRAGWGVAAAKCLATVVPLALGLLFLARHDTESGHRALIVAILAAVLVQVASPRRRPGWTRRRLAFAVVACGLYPLLAFVAPHLAGPDSSFASSLARRCRFGSVPTDDVERLALWARENTPASARFVTPPGPKTFRLWSRRAVAFNRAASPYHAEGLKDWSDRFRAHVDYAGDTDGFVRAYLDDRHGLESRYARLSPDRLAALAADQGAEYVLAAAPSDRSGSRSGPLDPVRVEGRYAIYRVARGPSVARLP